MIDICCSKEYLSDFKEYSEKVLIKSGFSSQNAERDTLYLADKGNVVAIKSYADLLFYKKILRKNNYRDAFGLYLNAAGLCEEEGGFSFTPHAYPPAFWSVGYYLVNYKCESFLKNCGKIETIEKLNRAERLSWALSLAVACVKEVRLSAALNLIGRIFMEVSENAELYSCLKDEVNHALSSLGHSLCVDSPSSCADAALALFEKAADEGYVYACNNLARRNAEKIFALVNESENKDSNVIYAEDTGDFTSLLNSYESYLKRSADKYEPYAANRLGLFYMLGEVSSPDNARKLCFRSRINHAEAKKYFKKATVYPDANSAWAFLNLIKYFHRDYDQDIDLLNEHMDYIKELNPKVYDIAMDM